MFISEVKHDVYGKRQTAKMKLLPSLFSFVYSGVKLFVFAMDSRRLYSIFVCFIYGLEKKNSKSEIIFAVCRLPLTSCLTSLLSVTAHSARPRKIPGWIVVVRENISVKKLAYKKVTTENVSRGDCLFSFQILRFNLKKSKKIQYDFWTGARKKI